MILYLIKLTLCLAIFLTVYHLVLEQEKMHAFNRFYLLGSLCLAMGIPFIHLETTPETVPLPAIFAFSQPAVFPTSSFYSSVPAETTPNFRFAFLLVVYSMVALLLAGRFINNLLQLQLTIIRNETIPYKNARLVLLPGNVLPHTFLHYIFISREDYERNRIEKSLLVHELAHVRQRHSLDVLLVELLQIVFWFDPLIYFYKKAIKLNHEFLADESVMAAGNAVSAYQHVLLNKAFSSRIAPLASHSTYSLTKKRLLMMTRTVSPLRASLKKMALLPLLMVMGLAFCTKVIAQEPVNKQAPPKKTSTPVRTQDVAMYYGNVTMQQAREIFYKTTYFRRVENGVAVNKKYDDFTAQEKARLMDPPSPPTKNVPTQAQLNAWLDPKIYGVWLDGKRVANRLLEKYTPTDFGSYGESILTKTAKNYGKHKFQVDLLTQPEFEKYRKEWLARFGIEE